MRHLAHALTATAILLTGTALAQDNSQATTAPVTSCEGNEANLKTYLEIHKVLFTERDSSRVEEFYAPVIISHNVDSGGGSRSEVPSSAMAAMWEKSKRVDPGRVLADELILCSGPYVIVRTQVISADNDGVGDYEPTGKPYKISAIDIYRFEDGRVVERWGNSDLVSFFDQIGYTFVPKDLAPKPE